MPDVLRKTVVKKVTNVPGNPDLHRFRLGRADLLKLPFLRSLIHWVKFEIDYSQFLVLGFRLPLKVRGNPKSKELV